MPDNHTAGPWEVGPPRTLTGNLSRVPILAPNAVAGRYIAEVSLWRDGGRPKPDEAEANARLIAAAPSLLVAGEAMIRLLEDSDADSCWCKREGSDPTTGVCQACAMRAAIKAAKCDHAPAVDPADPLANPADLCPEERGE